MPQAVRKVFIQKMYRQRLDVSTGFCRLHYVRQHNTLNLTIPLHHAQHQSYYPLRRLAIRRGTDVGFSNRNSVIRD